MTRNLMIYYLKQILPYNDKWYNTLSDKQVYAIYIKYVLNNYKSKEDKWYEWKAEEIINEYYLQDIDTQYEFLKEICDIENINYNKLYKAIKKLPKPKNLIKRKNGMILADNGHWEPEL